MTWFRVDDTFYRSKKVRKLGSDRVPAVGLWTMCGNWSADNLTDGFVPWEVVEDWDSGRAWAGRLLEVGLWFEAEVDGEKGIQFHDWTDYQPTKAEVDRRRDDARERMRKLRGSRSGEPAAGHDEQFEGCSEEGSQDVRANTERTDAERSSDVRDPVPSLSSFRTNEELSSDPAAPEPDTEPSPDEPQRDDVDALCQRLSDWVVSNGAKKPRVTQRWKQQARLLLDQDKRELAKALNLIDWCQQDGFWMSRVMSIPKFRDQYDQLAMQAREEWRKNAARTKANAANTDPDVNPWAGTRYTS